MINENRKKLHIKIDELEDRVKELEKEQLRMGEDVGELQRFQAHLVQILEETSRRKK